jgi:hypothetical protein
MIGKPIMLWSRLCSCDTKSEYEGLGSESFISRAKTSEEAKKKII